MAGISKAEREARAAAAAAAQQGGQTQQAGAGEGQETSNAGGGDAAALEAKTRAEAEAVAQAEADAKAAAEKAAAEARAKEVELTAALAALPGEYTDADYVVAGMRGHFGSVFTDAHEAFVREVVVERAPTAKLVPMVRSADDFPAPHEADVHPDEVANYAAGGWRQAEA